MSVCVFFVFLYSGVIFHVFLPTSYFISHSCVRVCISLKRKKNSTAHYLNQKFALETSPIPFVLLEISLNPSRLTSSCSLSKMSLYSKESLIKGASYWNSTAVDSSFMSFRKPTLLRSKRDSQRIYLCSLLLAWYIC